MLETGTQNDDDNSDRLTQSQNEKPKQKWQKLFKTFFTNRIHKKCTKRRGGKSAGK